MKSFTLLAAWTLLACASGERNSGSSSDAGGGAADASAPDGSIGSIVPPDAVLAADAPPIDAPLVTDPFDPASCPSPPITQAQLAAKFPAGGTYTTFGNYGFYAERRSCNAQTGCTSWSIITAKIQLEEPYTMYMGSAGTFTANAGTWFNFGFEFDAGGNLGTYGDTCNVANPIDQSPNITGCGSWELRPTDVESDWMVPEWTGVLASDCARLAASTSSDAYEYQWVILGQF